MAKAIWQGRVLAESPRYEMVEGNVYFPPDTIDRRFFKDSATTTLCHWKGTAHYYSVAVDGTRTKTPPGIIPNRRRRRRRSRITSPSGRASRSSFKSVASGAGEARARKRMSVIPPGNPAHEWERA